MHTYIHTQSHIYTHTYTHTHSHTCYISLSPPLFPSLIHTHMYTQNKQIVRYRLDFFIECARDADAKNVCFCPYICKYIWIFLNLDLYDLSIECARDSNTESYVYVRTYVNL